MQFQFLNERTDPITVIVEPWAEEFSVPSKSVLSISIDSAKAGLLETALSGEYFIVGLWAGCRAKVSLDGEDRMILDIPVPG